MQAGRRSAAVRLKEMDMRLITLGIGAALGYFLGSREGRQNLNKMTSNAQKFWNDPKTQEKVSEVQGQAAAKWEEAKSHEKVQDVAATVQAKVDDAKAKAADVKAGVQAKVEDAKTSGDGTVKAEADVISDPSTPMADEGPVGQN